MREESNLNSGADEERAAVQNKQRWGGQKKCPVIWLVCIFFLFVLPLETGGS